jgi:hypothetical protein
LISTMLNLPSIITFEIISSRLILKCAVKKFTLSNAGLTGSRDGSNNRSRWLNDLFYIKPNIERIEKEAIHLCLEKVMFDPLY